MFLFSFHSIVIYKSSEPIGYVSCSIKNIDNINRLIRCDSFSYRFHHRFASCFWRHSPRRNTQHFCTDFVIYYYYVLLLSCLTFTMTDSRGISETLKKYFGHKSFKSELQERAIKCAVKSKKKRPGVTALNCYTIVIFIFQKNRMSMCRCPRDQESHCASSCPA